MATAASRRLATAALSAAVLVPSGLLLAAPGFADSATPTAGIGQAIYVEASAGPVAGPVSGPLPGQYVPATESSPATPGWITGGTLQESQAKPAVKPATKPVARPAARPATVSQPVRVRRPAAVQGPTVTRDAATPAGSPTVLPFTGPGRLEAQTAAGAGLVLLGAFVMVAARPRRTR